MSMGYSRMAYPRCNGSFAALWGRMVRCSHRGIHHENNKNYCGVHAPSRIAARAAKREAKRQEVTP